MALTLKMLHQIVSFSLTVTTLLPHACANFVGRAPSKPKYPFNTLVAFGDQLVDNGNGSFAHGLDPGNIYGFHTWTDGPVVPMYLAGLLGVPLIDYAWGGAFGGGLIGSTLDNEYTPSKNMYNGKPVPSTKEQIFDNYTVSASSSEIQNALQLIWAGQNDIKKQTNWYAADPSKITVDATTNIAFFNNYTSLLVSQAEYLVKAGAPAVVVMNIYPIHTAPETTYFFCKGNAECVQNWGKVIEAANDHLKQGLSASQYSDQIIYYDVFNFMIKVMKHKDKYGYTEPLDFYCDGNHSLSTCKWPQCRQNKPSWSGARPFFWFNNGQPETTVHELIAKDVKKVIDKHFRK